MDEHTAVNQAARDMDDQIHTAVNLAQALGRPGRETSFVLVNRNAPDGLQEVPVTVELQDDGTVFIMAVAPWGSEYGRVIDFEAEADREDDSVFEDDEDDEDG